MKQRRFLSLLAVFLVVLSAALVFALVMNGWRREDASLSASPILYQPRNPDIDLRGFRMIARSVSAWPANASLEEIAERWRLPGYRLAETIEKELTRYQRPPDQQMQGLLMKAVVFASEGDTARAYRDLEEARTNAEKSEDLARDYLFTIIYLQGVVALRRGENENCVLCRGECSCIFPIAPAAVHRNPEGSRRAIGHFREYLQQFPDDLEVRWLLNLAHMTLAESPAETDPQFALNLDGFLHSECDIGKFRDVGHLLGVNRFNQAGGAIMDDFDNDGRLDIVVTSFDPTEPMGFYRNNGDGTFEDRTVKAGLKAQLGGAQCMQCDYNNDGRLDIFVCRGAWYDLPVRPSLLRNNGKGTFTDVTEAAGLSQPLNSDAAAWADFDNDGFVDLYVCCEKQPNRLYRNKGDGTFEEVAARAGVACSGKFCKGGVWLDYDNDDYPDLFLNNMNGTAQLFHNNRDGTFQDVTLSLGIHGPAHGFSCWAWDFDNDGWLDIFAASSFDSLQDVLKGMQGQPHGRSESNKLYRNQSGKGFADLTREAGLDQVFAVIGSNFGDFDNDGYLDFYLGTGGTAFSTLVPNRMFKNVAGQRFADITVSSGTGHLQKSHGVACGDWDRDGDIDVFVEIGGAVNGDKYHNVLFNNPGQGNHWLTLKLIGQRTNRAAIGARIKAITAGDKPLTVCRHVTSGSSFGANPFEQTLGLAQAERITSLEIHWPTSGTTQVFRDVAVDQAIEVTELATEYRKLNWTTSPLPN